MGSPCSLFNWMFLTFTPSILLYSSRLKQVLLTLLSAICPFLMYKFTIAQKNKKQKTLIPSRLKNVQA
jgi:hypothetical protein